MSLKSAPFAQNVADELALIRNVLAKNGGNTIYGFHVNANESDPASAVTYLKDAVGMTPAKMNYTSDKFEYGSWEDAFFLPRPCMLKFDGTVDYYLMPNDLSKKENGSASDIANVNYGGNAMMEFGRDGKKIWYKIVNDADDNGYSVYIADHKADKDYEAWSFINNQNQYVDHFYMAMYNGSLDSNGKLRSLSGQTAMYGKTANQEISYAKANNTGSDVLWYTETFADCTLINLLLILMGKSLDTQTVFGQGHTTGGSQAVLEAETTGSLNNRGLFYGSNGTTTDMKVFGIENYWGHQWRRIAGLMNSNYNYYYKMTYGIADGSTLASYGTSISGMLNGGATPTTNGYQKKNKVVGKSAILPIDVTGSQSTYYCDNNWNSTATTYALRGGNSGHDAACGTFCLGLNVDAGFAYWGIGAALSCKPLAR